jgi:hypothetical protein
LNNPITLPQLWAAIAFPAVLSLAGLTVSIVSVLNNSSAMVVLNSRISDLKADVMHLSTRMDTLIGVVNEIDKRTYRP